MNTNDFILPASKSGNYAKQKSKKLLDLRLETVHLEMENHEMEQKLHQLKLNMEKEKEERQFSSGHRWKSGQAVSLNYANQASLQSKDSSVKPSQVSSGRMRLKVLKDHIPEPIKQPVAPKSSFIASLEKTKIKGKACGQCENKCALLTCLECGEDYCVSCFSKIHQKGALKLHRTSPVQGKYAPVGKLDAAQQFRKDIDLSPVNHDTKIEKSPLFKNISPSGTVPSSYSAESVSTLSTKPFHEKLDGGSLLHGTFNEEESSKSFKEILMDWRHGNPEYKAKQSSFEVETESVGESEVQTLLTVVSKPVDIEFTDNGLNYLEKLLLKKHRRMPVDQLTEFRHSNTFLDESLWALNEEENGLTAEEMENHECYAALFRKQTSEGDPERSVSSLRIIELNDAYEEGLEVSTSFVVNEVDSNDSSSEQSVTVIKPQNNSLCFGEKSDSSPVHATERNRKPSHHSNYLVDKDNISNPSDGKKKRRSSTKIYEADSADSITFITLEATCTSLHGTIDNSLRETVNCSAHDRAVTQNNSTKLDSHKRGSSHISPETTLNAFTVDSKDIPSTSRLLKGNTQVVDLCNVHNSKGLDTSATTNSSMVNQNLELVIT